MKLSDIAPDANVKVLAYGPSGTGKTCLAAGFPGPIEYWDFDHKISSAAQHYKGQSDRLSSIDVYQFAQLGKHERIAEWEKRLKFIDANKTKLPFKTLVVDSLTTLSSMMLDDYIHRSQKGIKRALADIPAMQDYQLLDKHLTQIISGLLALPCNVVFIGHMNAEKDESTGMIMKRPLMAGKFADKLPIYFEEVYVSQIDSNGKYVLQTQGDSTMICRTQRKHPKFINSSYDEIIKQR